MHIRIRFVAALAVTALVLLVSGCTSKETIETRKMTIKSIDIGSVRDGLYIGDYSYGGFTYVVNVEVRNHKILGITIQKNRNTKYAKKAEGVVERIVSEQRNDVDAISGATTTSKALLKAIERALAKGL
jgi:uncharacterized protein with FMN-binding domain